MATKGFRQAGHTPSLVAALLHFDVSFMVWVLLGSVGAFIASDLHLSAGQKGFMVAVPPLGGAAFRLILGSLADRVGIKSLGLLTLGLTLVPLAWGAFGATTFAEVIGVGLLLGVAGASFAVALPLASRWYPPEHQGLALGIAGAGNSGTVVASLLAPRIAEAWGWQAVFGIAMLPILISLTVFTLMAKDSPATVNRIGLKDYLGILKQRDSMRFCLFYGVTFGGFVGLASYLAIFFKDQYGLTKVHAGDL